MATRSRRSSLVIVSPLTAATGGQVLAVPAGGTRADEQEDRDDDDGAEAEVEVEVPAGVGLVAAAAAGPRRRASAEGHGLLSYPFGFRVEGRRGRRARRIVPHRAGEAGRLPVRKR